MKISGGIGGGGQQRGGIGGGARGGIGGRRSAEGRYMGGAVNRGAVWGGGGQQRGGARGGIGGEAVSRGAVLGGGGQQRGGIGNLGDDCTNSCRGVINLNELTDFNLGSL